MERMQQELEDRTADGSLPLYAGRLLTRLVLLLPKWATGLNECDDSTMETA